jgi:hypothetical protein
MLTRVVALPAAALVVLVAAPALIVRTVSPPEQPPPPPTAALTLHLTGGSGDAFVHIAAKGQPKRQTFRLVDADGLHPALVDRVKKTRCDGARLRLTGTGTRRWCLHVRPIRTGRQLSGTIKGGTTLTLTVMRRDGYGLPILFLFLGFLASVVVPLFSKRLQHFAGELAIARLLEKNEDAGRDRVVDAPAWAQARLAAGAKQGDVYATLAAVFAKGPAQVRAAREALKQALRQSALPSATTYYGIAEKEADRRDFVMSDFIDDAGKARETTKPADLLGGLVQIDHTYRELEALARTIEATLTPGCAAEPREAVAFALDRLSRIGRAQDVGTLDEPVDRAHAAYDAKYADEACRLDVRGGVEELIADGVRGRRAGLEVRAVSALDLRHAALAGWTAVGIVLTIIAIATIYAFGGATVWEAVYDPKADFAGFTDYFKLFSAAFASGAAASTLALLAAWRPKPSTTPA